MPVLVQLHRLHKGKDEDIFLAAALCDNPSGTDWQVT